MIEMREAIIVFDIKNNHKWDAVYKDIREKTHLSEEEIKETLKDFDTNSVITIIDEDYPEAMKYINKPPFILYREDIDKINEFVNYCNEYSDMYTLLGQKRLNGEMLNCAIKDTEASISELKDDLGKFAYAVELLNNIRKDDE